MSNSKDKELSIIKGASHLFEEEELMQETAEIAAQRLKGHFISVVKTNGVT